MDGTLGSGLLVSQGVASPAAGKPDYLLCPFNVIVDSREQSPFSFRGFRSDAKDKHRPIVVRTAVAALKSGDYSIEGFESRIAVERKSLVDLYGTLGGGRERFERELQRLNEMEFAAVVIEAGWSSILGSPPPQSKLSPKTVFRSVIAWQQRFPGIHWWALDTRHLAEHCCFRILERFWNVEQRRLKEQEEVTQ
jgi:DNA excision repair protein ERCC-4